MGLHPIIHIQVFFFLLPHHSYPSFFLFVNDRQDLSSYMFIFGGLLFSHGFGFNVPHVAFVILFLLSLHEFELCNLGLAGGLPYKPVIEASTNVQSYKLHP